MIVDLIVQSFRNLLNKKLRTWLTLLGIVIGIASVIALIGLGGGLRLAITGQFGAVSADILTIQAGGVALAGPPGTSVVNPLQEDYVDEIEKISGVEFVAGRLIEEATIEFNDVQRIGAIVSIPEGDARKKMYAILDLDAEKGRLLRDGDNNKIMLGYDFIEEENVYGKQIKIGDKIEIQSKNFEVVGIMESKGNIFIDGSMFMADSPLRDLVNKQGATDIIIAQVKNLDQIDSTKEAIEKYLRKERDVKEGEEDFSVQTAQSTIDTINSVLGGVQAFVIIVAAISMVVGAIGIINTMFTAVLERRKEIGIMKSIGAKNEDIFYLFLFESGLLGATGGTLGIIMGSLAAIGGTKALGSLLNLDVSPDITLTLVIGSLAGTFLIGAISGIIPAMQAARMNPIDALREQN